MSAVLLTASTATYMLYNAGVISLKFYFLAELITKLYAGFSFKDWLSRKLERGSFSLTDVVLANSELHAKLRFMERSNKHDKETAADAPTENTAAANTPA